MVRMQNASASLALVFAAVSSCGGERVGSDAETMSETLAALNSAVSECQTQREACETAHGAGSTTCDEQLRACHGKAVDRAMPALKEGASACATEARACREAAADDDAKRACSEEHKQCVSESDQGRAHADGGAGHGKDGSNGNGEAVRLCTEALHGCMETDTDPKVCTAALRSCLDACIENHGQGRGHTGAGKPGRGAPHGADVDGGIDSADCNAERKACVDSGKSPMECAQAVRACRTK